MKIKVEWLVNEESGSITIDIEDLDVDTKEEWFALSNDEKIRRIETGLDEHTEQPYMCLDKWEEL